MNGSWRVHQFPPKHCIAVSNVPKDFAEPGVDGGPNYKLKKLLGSPFTVWHFQPSEKRTLELRLFFHTHKEMNDYYVYLRLNRSSFHGYFLRADGPYLYKFEVYKSRESQGNQVSRAKKSIRRGSGKKPTKASEKNEVRIITISASESEEGGTDSDYQAAHVNQPAFLDQSHAISESQISESTETYWSDSDWEEEGVLLESGALEVITVGDPDPDQGVGTDEPLTKLVHEEMVHTSSDIVFGHLKVENNESTDSLRDQISEMKEKLKAQEELVSTKESCITSLKEQLELLKSEHKECKRYLEEKGDKIVTLKMQIYEEQKKSSELESLHCSTISVLNKRICDLEIRNKFQEDYNHDQLKNQQLVLDYSRSIETHNLVTQRDAEVAIAQLQLLIERQQMLTAPQQRLTEQQYPLTSPQQPLTQREHLLTAPQQPLTEREHLLTAPQKRLTERQQLSIAPQQLLTERQQLSTAPQQRLTERPHLLTALQQRLTERQQLSTAPQQRLTERQEMLTAPQQRLTERQHLSTDRPQMLAQQFNVPRPYLAYGSPENPLKSQQNQRSYRPSNYTNRQHYKL